MRHFRRLESLQVTDSALLKVIVVRAHAGEPPFDFNQLRIPLYELRTDGDLTWPFGLLIFCRAFDSIGARAWNRKFNLLAYSLSVLISAESAAGCCRRLG